MPDIFTNDTSTPIKTKGNDFIQPLREATPLLVGKLVFALLIPILLYILVHITSTEVASFFSLTDDFSLEFLMFLIILTIIQIFLVLLITLQWKNHVYYLTDTYIQENKGILTLTDRMIDLKNVRDISVRQGVLGRLLNYGDILIESSAPEFHEVLIIVGAPNPHQHEAFLRKFV